jgi:putative transcriptional regulator
MIQCRLRELIAAKSRSERRKISYVDVREATGVNTGTLVRLANDKADRVALETIERLCLYFECSPGDLFVMVRD